nr:hypothetical protein [Pseudomonadota bacterium]
MTSGGDEAEGTAPGSKQAARLFRLIWWPLFLLVAASTLAGLYFHSVPYEMQTRPFAEFGMRWDWDRGELGQPLGDESRAAGIEAGRVVVAVNGRATDPRALGPSTLALLQSAGGDRVVVITRGRGGDLRTHSLRRGSHHLEQAYADAPIDYGTVRTFETWLDFVAALIGIAAAFLLYRLHRRDRVAGVLSVAFLMLCGDSDAAWTSFFLLDVQQLPFVFKMLGGACLLVGILLFPDGRFSSRWGGWLAAVIPAWALLAIAFSFGGLGVLEEPMNLAGGVLALLCVGLLWGRYRRLPESIERQQIRWATFGLVVGIVLAVIGTTLALLLAWTEAPASYAALRILYAVVAPGATLAMAAGFLVSVLRYRLYDVDVVISRSAAAAALTLTLAAVYAAASQIIETLFQSSFGREGGVWPGAVGAAVAVLLFVPLNNRTQAWAERRFQKGVLQLRRDLPDCVGDLRETASLDELLGEILARTRAGARSVAAAIEIDGRIVAQD